MSMGKAARRHSQYCRRRVEEHFRGTDEGKTRIEKAEARFTAALTRAGDRIDAMGFRAMSMRAAGGSCSNPMKAGDGEVQAAPEEEMAYSPTSPGGSPVSTPRADITGSTADLPPCADEGRQTGPDVPDEHTTEAGLAGSRNPAPEERASSSTRTAQESQRTKRQS